MGDGRKNHWLDRGILRRKRNTLLKIHLEQLKIVLNKLVFFIDHGNGISNKPAVERIKLKDFIKLCNLSINTFHRLM